MRSLGIVSVMFDDSSTNPEKIVLALRAAGVDARVLHGQRVGYVHRKPAFDRERI